MALFFGQWFESQEVLDYAKELKLDISKYDLDQLEMGISVEKEHDGKEGKDIDVVKSKKDLLKIVLAHLREDPQYYTKLKKARL